MGRSIRSGFFNAHNLKTVLPLVAAVGVMGVSSGCSDDADVASHNISKASDNFEVNRRIVFYNGITGEYILTIEGRSSIKVDTESGQLEVTIKTGEDEYKKHFLGLSDNVTYFAEQIDSIGVSPYHYRVTFKPQTIVPDVDFRGDLEELAPNN